MDGHQFRGARIHRDMMLVSSVCRRALGCEWGGVLRTDGRHWKPARKGRIFYFNPKSMRARYAYRGTGVSLHVGMIYAYRDKYCDMCL